MSQPADADSTARFSVGDMVVFAPEGPPTEDGAFPACHGMVVSVPIAGQQTHYRVELPEGTLLDLHPNSLLDPTDLEPDLSLIHI